MKSTSQEAFHITCRFPTNIPSSESHLVEKNAGAGCDSQEGVDPLPLEIQDGHLTGEIHPVLTCSVLAVLSDYR